MDHLVWCHAVVERTAFCVRVHCGGLVVAELKWNVGVATFHIMCEKCLPHGVVFNCVEAFPENQLRRSIGCVAIRGPAGEAAGTCLGGPLQRAPVWGLVGVESLFVAGGWRVCRAWGWYGSGGCGISQCFGVCSRGSQGGVAKVEDC